MLITRFVVVPEKVEEFVDHVECDICGESSQFQSKTDWTLWDEDSQKTVIQVQKTVYRVGVDDFGNDDEISSVEIHLCPDCFDLLPNFIKKKREEYGKV